MSALFRIDPYPSSHDATHRTKRRCLSSEQLEKVLLLPSLWHYESHRILFRSCARCPLGAFSDIFEYAIEKVYRQKERCMKLLRPSKLIVCVLVPHRNRFLVFLISWQLIVTRSSVTPRKN